MRSHCPISVYGLCAVALLAAGCGKQTPASAPPSSSSAQHIVQDGMGRAVPVVASAQRIVSLSPAATDILEISLGIHAEVAGVTRYCRIPAADEKRVVRIGGVVDPDYERILTLQPDLVIIPWLADHTLQDKLISLGLTVVVMHAEGLQGVLDDIRLIGRATGHAAAGEAAAKNIESIRTIVAARWRDIPENQRPRVLIRMGEVSPAPGSYVDDLVTAAGGRNVLPRGAKAWVTLGPEAIFQLAPDLIIDIPAPDENATAVRGESPAGNGSAKTMLIHDGDAFYHPGPEVGRGIWDLARAIYPQLFPEPEPPMATAPGAN